MNQLKDFYKSKSLETRAIILFLSAIFFIGVACPSLVSSKSTIAVWIGIGLGLGFFAVAVKEVKSLYNELKEKIKDEG